MDKKDFGKGSRYKAFAIAASIIVFTILPSILFIAHQFPRTIREQETKNEREIWLDEAVAAGDPDLCDRIQNPVRYGDYSDVPEVERYFCKAEYWGKIGEVENCARLDDFEKFPGTRTQKDRCLEAIAETAPTEAICTQLPSLNQPMCLYSAAKNTRNKDLCRKIVEDGYLTLCEREFEHWSKRKLREIAYGARRIRDCLSSDETGLNLLAILSCMTDVKGKPFHY